MKSKLSTAQKSKTTTFSRVFHPPKMDNFLGKSKLNFWSFRQKMKISNDQHSQYDSMIQVLGVKEKSEQAWKDICYGLETVLEGLLPGRLESFLQTSFFFSAPASSSFSLLCSWQLDFPNTKEEEASCHAHTTHLGHNWEKLTSTVCFYLKNSMTAKIVEWRRFTIFCAFGLWFRGKQ